ncbi:MAG: hypothetical protein LBI31_02655 [Zoogloeaceae bacterium]|jgi:hypothetical protein|nr:hypothetical protein [Zoogloeaceae bacterium]
MENHQEYAGTVAETPRRPRISGARGGENQRRLNLRDEEIQPERHEVVIQDANAESGKDRAGKESASRGCQLSAQEDKDERTQDDAQNIPWYFRGFEFNVPVHFATLLS